MIWGCLKKDNQTRIPQHPQRYSAYSLIDHYKGFKQVFVAWYCYQRDAAPECYSRLVADYQDLPAPYKRRAEMYVDALFNKSEIVLLRQHVKDAFGIDIRPLKESLPMSEDSYLNYIHPEIMVDHKRVGILDIAPLKAFSIHFKARGVYDLHHCQPAI
jgi:hypothetical protein